MDRDEYIEKCMSIIEFVIENGKAKTVSDSREEHFEYMVHNSNGVPIRVEYFNEPHYQKLMIQNSNQFAHDRRAAIVFLATEYNMIQHIYDYMQMKQIANDLFEF